jgi:hypothetical protein
MIISYRFAFKREKCSEGGSPMDVFIACPLIPDWYFRKANARVCILTAGLDAVFVIAEIFCWSQRWCASFSFCHADV